MNRRATPVGDRSQCAGPHTLRGSRSEAPTRKSRSVSAPFTPPPHTGPEGAAPRREDSFVFVIRLLNGEEVQAAENDELTINEHTGVVSVTRIDGFEEVTTHFSPSAWASVTHRVKEAGMRRSMTGVNKR